MDFEWNEDMPLERGIGETSRANAALRDYAFTGPGRSLRSLGARYANAPQTESPPTRYPSTVFGWSVRYAWQARIAVWERIKAAEDEAEWDRRRREWRETEFSKAQKLIERVEQMLAYPLSEQLVTREEHRPDGKVVQHVTVRPVRWSQRDIAAFLRAASELARLAGGMETERRAVEGEIVVKGYVTISPDDWPSKDEPKD